MNLLNCDLIFIRIVLCQLRGTINLVKEFLSFLTLKKRIEESMSQMQDVKIYQWMLNK